MDSVLAITVVATAVLCLARLARLVRRDGLGASAPLSMARGSARRGVAYALGPGLSPFAKESARHHLGVFALGVVFHAGVLAAALWLVATLLSRQAGGPWRTAWSVPLMAAVVSGIVLLVRRARSPLLRSISVPDDYVSNALTCAFVTLALVSLWIPRVTPAFHLVSIFLLLYLPIGKITHCVFFFIARARFGALFGHRGALPPVHGRVHP